MKSYTTEQVAKMMQLNEETVRNYIKSGKLEAYLVGNDYRITEEAIQKYIDKYKKVVG